MKAIVPVKVIVLSTAVNVVFALGAAAQAPGGAPPAGGPPSGMSAPGADQPEANPPVIDSVTVQGNNKITTAALMKDTTIKLGVKVSKPLVRGELDRITAVYKKAGYDMSVAPDIAHPADGHVTITFKIDENGKGGNAGPAPAAGSAGSPPPPG